MSYQNYGCNNNQNVYVQSGRPTSRVLNPPGGRSSLTLGVVAPPPPPPASMPSPQQQQQQQQHHAVLSTTTGATVVVSQPQPQQQPPTVIEHPSQGKEDRGPNGVHDDIVPDMMKPTTTTPLTAPVSANAYVSGSNMNGGCYHTGRPTSRVLAPPGGHSSFKLG